MSVSGTAVRVPTRLRTQPWRTINSTEEVAPFHTTVTADTKRTELIIQVIGGDYGLGGPPPDANVRISVGDVNTNGEDTDGGIVVSQGETLVLDKGAQRAVVLNNIDVVPVFVNIIEVVQVI